MSRPSFGTRSIAVRKELALHLVRALWLAGSGERAGWPTQSPTLFPTSPTLFRLTFGLADHIAGVNEMVPHGFTGGVHSPFRPPFAHSSPLAVIARLFYRFPFAKPLATFNK